MRALLHVLNGQSRNARFALPSGEIVRIGRGADTHICLPDPSVSRLHAEIDTTIEPPVLCNRSGQGTMIGGDPVVSWKLKDGDTFDLGGVYIRYHANTNALDEETAFPEAPVLTEVVDLQKVTEHVASWAHVLSPSDRPDDLGRLGRFRVLALIGEGGMGRVFRAKDTRDGRLVALKVMRMRAVKNPKSRARFEREARAVSALRSDHVVRIYDIEHAGAVPYFSMELLEGATLASRWGEHCWPTFGEIIRAGREICLGLAAAHARGIIHRDIKPENIWLERRPGSTFRVKLLDFGLAREAGSEDRLSGDDLVGTPGWMSPEQANNSPRIDGRSDLFGVGCLLYWLCARREPFFGDSLTARLLVLATRDPKPVRIVNPETPAALADLIDRLLRKNPDERPASAEAVARELGDGTASP